MTTTEQIINLLEINENVPALVLDEFSNIIAKNGAWLNVIGKMETGKNFYSLFDKNISLLVKNNILDSKTFSKVKKREVKLLSSEENFQIIISPFKIADSLYFYVLLYSKINRNNFIVYPSLDDFSYYNKYDNLFEVLQNKTQEESFYLSLQNDLDIEKEPIAIMDSSGFQLMNTSFKIFSKSEEDSDVIPTSTRLKTAELFLLILSIEEEINKISSLFVIENTYPKLDQLTCSNKILVFPLKSFDDDTNKTLIIGELDVDSDSSTKIAINNNIPKISESVPTIIYDKNNFDILEANQSACKFYGYDLEELKSTNFTSLLVPEDLQKLLIPIADNKELTYKQIKKDGSVIEVSAERELTFWQNKEVYIEKINIKKLDEETKNDEIETNDETIINDEIRNINEQISDEDRVVEEKIKVTTQNRIEEVSPKISPFLSSLFHELLTPVNVILGFVQEIIDSIESPTEEQEESAKIIKENQQLLLQTMNTAVQYAKLEENVLPLNKEDFDLYKYFVDLEESIAKVAGSNNVKVNFSKSSESFTLKSDKQKILAAVSYFIKFVVKFTKSPNVFINFEIKDNELFVFAKDSENEISNIVLENVLLVYNSNQSPDSRNYGLSSITIKLAQKLNSVLGAKVMKNNVSSISLVIPINAENIAHKVEDIDISINLEKDNLPEDDEEGIPYVEEIIETEDEVLINAEEFIIENDIQTILPDSITLSEIDEKIVDDLVDEEEIITEEIATLESEKVENVFNIGNYSCLFLDDSIDAQLFFKSQMGDFKFLKVCANLSEALPLFKKHNFDFIYVDINLNDKYNGFDALKIIRQFNDYKSTPIIAVTAYPFEGDREKFINFGFTDYLVKPLLREQLLKSIESVIS